MQMRHTRTCRESTRQAVLVLELLIVLPLSLVMFFTVVEFGLILSRGNQVLQAAAVGATAASTQGRMPALWLGPDTVAAVDAQLTTMGLAPSDDNRQVFIEERIMPGPGSHLTTGTFFYVPPDLEQIPPDTVRVTVIVRLTQLTPDLLDYANYSVQNGFLFASSIRPYNGPLP